mmetsp:Transcript_13575/g.42732  ORF Transcript_13575/g.42732 Transcript_13575/m.42732 type:complete len:200 (+) Transcript_13575:535-1134(+)
MTKRLCPLLGRERGVALLHARRSFRKAVPRVGRRRRFLVRGEVAGDGRRRNCGRCAVAAAGVASVRRAGRQRPQVRRGCHPAERVVRPAERVKRLVDRIVHLRKRVRRYNLVGVRQHDHRAALLRLGHLGGHRLRPSLRLAGHLCLLLHSPPLILHRPLQRLDPLARNALPPLFTFYRLLERRRRLHDHLHLCLGVVLG